MATTDPRLILVALAAFGLVHSARGEGSELPDGTVTVSDDEVAIGFVDAGDTCDNLDDFDAACPFTGSTSPDVFYTFTPADDTAIVASLCGSRYDTKVYVLDADLQEIACNDDACGSDGFKSEIDCTLLSAGETYHVAVDGFGGECGVYEIVISTCKPPPPCLVTCPPDGQPDGERCGGDENDGCNTAPPSFTELKCGMTYCGTAWAQGGQRDTEWYEIDNTGDDFDTTYTWCAIAEYDHVVGIVTDGSGIPVTSCISSILDPFATGVPCEEACIDVGPLPPGVYWFFAAPIVFDLIPCHVSQPLGNDYLATLDCEADVPPCPWDFDGDNGVGFADLLKILSNWGPCPGAGG